MSVVINRFWELFHANCQTTSSPSFPDWSSPERKQIGEKNKSAPRENWEREVSGKSSLRGRRKKREERGKLNASAKARREREV